jgi:hypothetical protein
MEKRRRNLRNKESIRQGEFFRVWGVFWRYVRDNIYDEPHVDGPYCPIHLLQLEVGYHEGNYAFRCKGNSQDGVHHFPGPKYDELIKPERNVNIQEALLHDTRERILAEIRKHNLE